MAFDGFLGDLRSALSGQCAFAVDAAAFEPGESHVDHRRATCEHILADGSAVGPHDVVRAEGFLNGAVDQKAAAVVDVAVAASGVGYGNRCPLRGPVDG